MKWSILLIPFMALQAFSHENCGQTPDGMIYCAHKLEHNPHENLQDILEWWSASPEQIRNAKCNNPQALTDDEILKYLESKKTKDKVSDSFFGMSFKDEDPYMLDLLKRLTAVDDVYARLAKTEHEKQKTFEIPKGCDKVLCAANHIFGEKNARRFFYALDKYNMNMSHVTEDDLAEWETKEVDTILEALDDLPPTLFPFDEKRKLKHYKRGYGPSLSTIANAQIMIFSVWEDTLGAEEQMSTIIHEIGHNIGTKFNLDTSKDWLDISGWQEIDGKWKPTKENTIISEYGETNPFEDFAESTVAYRYNGENLKKRSPEKYEFIKKYVYQGLEFDKEENCQTSKSKIASYLKDIPAKQKLEDGFKSCEKEFANIFHGKNSSFKSCLSQAKVAKHVEAQIKNDKEVKDDERYQKTILNSLKNIAPEIPVTQAEEDAVQTELTIKMMNHFKERFSSISGCDKQKENGWMNIINFNKEVSGDGYNSKIDEAKINEFSYNVCKSIPAKQWSAECRDLVPFFKEFLPKAQKSQVDLAKVKNEATCSF